MRLTNFSDYALRLLMFAAAHEGHRITIGEAARVYGISRPHLMKVANLLTRAGFLSAVRGRSGGLLLARKPDQIRLGDVVRAAEPDFQLVECMSSDGGCIVTGRCKLGTVLEEALHSFIATLDTYTLNDLALNPADFGIAATLGTAEKDR